MSKRYFCDLCQSEVLFLYDLHREDRKIISVCRFCFYAMQTKDLCKGEVEDCTKCKDSIKGKEY